MSNSYSDNIKITSIIHAVKKEQFNGVLQTTLNPYLDKFLDLEVKRTVKGVVIEGKIKHKREKDKEMMESKKKVVLSIDEHCYQKEIYNDYYFTELAENIEENSILSKDFKILKKYNCKLNKIPFNISLNKKKKKIIRKIVKNYKIISVFLNILL
jgi:hypothetical protein